MHISEPFGADKRLGTLSIAFTLTHTFSICHFSTLLCQELNMARCAEKNHFNLSSQAHLQAIGKVCYAPGYSLFYPHPWIAYLFAGWNSRSWFCVHIYLYIALALYVCVWVCVLAPKRAKLWNGLMFLMTPHCVPRDFGPPMSKEQKTGKDGDSGRKREAGGVGLVCF